MIITSIADARAALDAAYRFLSEEIVLHEHRCNCPLCQACMHAADGGTLLAKLEVQS